MSDAAFFAYILYHVEEVVAISSVLRVFIMNVEFYQMPFPHLFLNLVICVFSLFLVTVTKKLSVLIFSENQLLVSLIFHYSFSTSYFKEATGKLDFIWLNNYVI